MYMFRQILELGDFHQVHVPVSRMVARVHHLFAVLCEAGVYVGLLDVEGTAVPGQTPRPFEPPLPEPPQEQIGVPGAPVPHDEI